METKDRRLGTAPLAVLLAALAGCASEPTPAEKRAADERAIAQVEAVQKQNPPARMIAPQPILFPDIEKHGLFGANCSFAPGDSMGAVLLAREKDAYMKIAGEMVRLASDPGSARMPLGTWSRYSGRAMALTLTRAEAADEPGGGKHWRAHLSITDPYNQVIYDTEGLVQCGA